MDTHNWSQMLIILLRDLVRTQIDLNDFAVLHTRQERVLLVGIWVEGDALWTLVVAECADTLSLGVYQSCMPR